MGKYGDIEDHHRDQNFGAYKNPGGGRQWDTREAWHQEQPRKQAAQGTAEEYSQYEFQQSLEGVLYGGHCHKGAGLARATASGSIYSDPERVPQWSSYPFTHRSACSCPRDPPDTSWKSVSPRSMSTCLLQPCLDRRPRHKASWYGVNRRPHNRSQLVGLRTGRINLDQCSRF